MSEVAERTGAAVTGMRTAYINATMLTEPVTHAVRTAREGTLLVMPGQYAVTQVLVPRRDLRQNRTG
jgi:hypothetical protein